MLTHLFMILTVAALPGLAGSSDVWQKKPVREWTREETQEFFRDSPWVHQIIVADPRAAQHAAGYPAPAREARREPSSAEGIKVEPQFGGNGLSVETAYYIEWSSAGIVRRAAAHYRALRGQGGEDGAPPPLGSFFITVSGYDLAVFEAASQKELRETAFLRLRERKVKIPPAGAEKVWNADGKIIAVRYEFPRQAEGEALVTDRDQTVNFVCKAGDLRLKTRFELGEMVIGKDRDL